MTDAPEKPGGQYQNGEAPRPRLLQDAVYISLRMRLHWKCEIDFSSLGEEVLMGAHMSAPLVLANPAVHEIGTRHRPLLRRLYASASCGRKQIQTIYIFSKDQSNVTTSDKNVWMNVQTQKF